MPTDTKWEFVLQDSFRLDLQTAYRHMNKDPKFSQFIVKKFPFLLEGSKSHFYKFAEFTDGKSKDMDLEKMTGDQFIEFLNRAEGGQLKDYYKSEEPLYPKCSKKLTGNSFSRNIEE